MAVLVQNRRTNACLSYTKECHSTANQVLKLGCSDQVCLCLQELFRWVFNCFLSLISAELGWAVRTNLIWTTEAYFVRRMALRALAACIRAVEVNLELSWQCCLNMSVTLYSALRKGFDLEKYSYIRPLIGYMTTGRAATSFLFRVNM